MFAISDSRATTTSPLPRIGGAFSPRITVPTEGRKASARALALSRPVQHRPPTVTAVDNCNDSGTGSLREAFDNAVTGDTIDLTALACSRISLTTGALVVNVDTLTVNGPGAAALTIDGGYSQGYYNSAVYHFGAGTLELNDMTITDAKYTGGNPTGGCIYSTGAIYMSGSTVTGCFIYSPSTTMAVSRGGGIYARGGVTAKYSTISNNFVVVSDYNGFGGGLDTPGGLIAKYSTIESNIVYSLGSSYTFGGGAVVAGSAQLLGTTIDGNYARNVGGISINGGAAYTATIGNSTISGNTASNVIGGIYVNSPATFQSSTITANFGTSRDACLATAGYNCAGGLQVSGVAAELQSNIMANNIAGNYYDDIGAGNGGDTSVGANNLVRGAEVPVPGDTLVGDPMLWPLTNNGGPTRTHAPRAGSLAIDHGNNAAGGNFDQRGSPFARVVGANADIGALELQGPNDGDFIFVNGFDS